jgi:dTDP-glucose 4,6-dehydratase
LTTAVVTGGAGFLGSHLCDFLLADGQRVVCVDNLDTGSLENIQHIKNGSDFHFINHDLTEPLFLEEPVDVVYHLASPASPIDYLRLPLHTLKVGSYGTHNMLGLAKFKRARFLLASTSEVYGDPQVHPQPETYWGHVNSVGPRGVYDEAKRYAGARSPRSSAKRSKRSRSPSSVTAPRLAPSATSTISCAGLACSPRARSTFRSTWETRAK